LLSPIVCLDVQSKYKSDDCDKECRRKTSLELSQRATKRLFIEIGEQTWRTDSQGSVRPAKRGISIRPLFQIFLLTARTDEVSACTGRTDCNSSLGFTVCPCPYSSTDRSTARSTAARRLQWVMILWLSKRTCCTTLAWDTAIESLKEGRGKRMNYAMGILNSKLKSKEAIQQSN
jgi:hypothetical protein